MTDRYRKSIYTTRKSLNIEIDDGVLTSFANKGDGVKSLATIAMLSQISSNKKRLIIVDEPENHLHPEAVRYINSVLCTLSRNNQVLISTHNPTFINRSKISSNWIVESGEAHCANRIDSIRQTLGVICSDNLMYSDYVVVVEGPTDRTLLGKLFDEDEELRRCMENKLLTIRSIGGTNNLKSEVYSLQRYCCNYIILLDGDGAGKDAAKTIRETLAVPNERIRFFMRGIKGETELEDFYNPDLYTAYLSRNGINIADNEFKNKSVKWSNRIGNIAAASGLDFPKPEEDRFKTEIVELIYSPLKDCLTPQGYELLTTIRNQVKQDLKTMMLLQ